MKKLYHIFRHFKNDGLSTWYFFRPDISVFPTFDSQIKSAASYSVQQDTFVKVTELKWQKKERSLFNLFNHSCESLHWTWTKYRIKKILISVATW